MCLFRGFIATDGRKVITIYFEFVTLVNNIAELLKLNMMNLCLSEVWIIPLQCISVRLMHTKELWLISLQYKSVK